MSQTDANVIAKDQDKKYFQIRISPKLRKMGVFQIRGYKEYLEIEFRDDCIITILYPNNIEELYKEVEQELLLETRLSKSQIDKIKYYVKDCTLEIEGEIKKNTDNHSPSKGILITSRSRNRFSQSLTLTRSM